MEIDHSFMLLTVVHLYAVYVSQAGRREVPLNIVSYSKVALGTVANRGVDATQGLSD